MLECGRIYAALETAGIRWFAGVPDSLLKNFCAYLADHVRPGHHVITANEGSAVALVAGHYLATGELGLVYLQNSGLGNAVNPLVSLADPEVYRIPMLLLVGWRGAPGVRDEPQHQKQGAITLSLLEALGTPHAILPFETDTAVGVVAAAAAAAKQRGGPFALVARKGTFAPYWLAHELANRYPMTREDAVKALVDWLDARAIVVATTGKASRELFEYRQSCGHGCDRDFLTVGSMGHASQIALGIALAQPARAVYCLDGDGALIMHMGSLAIIGSCHPKNLKHVVINNGAHDSVGGQPTVGFDIDIPALAKACGYESVLQATTQAELAESLAHLVTRPGPVLLEIRVTRGARANLGRPTTTPIQNRDALMQNLSAGRQQLAAE